MLTTDVKQWIKRELPVLFREDVEIHQFILELTRPQYADKQVTESRFDRLLDELRRDREANAQRWAEHLREHKQSQEEDRRKWDEQNSKWDAHLQAEKQSQEEQKRQWDAHLQAEKQSQDEQKRQWNENQQAIRDILARIDAQQSKHDSSIGAIGARWGFQAEASFRNALASILEKSFGVQVLNITEFDAAGEVFGHPEQVELDVIIRNGILILCEIKASMSRGDVYLFGRKAQFYERRRQCQAARRIIITPMIREDGRQVAAKLGIEVCSYAEDVKV